MRLGIGIEETWRFFDEIYAELSQHHQTKIFNKRYYKFPVFRIRINRYLYLRDLEAFMKQNDVVFFEWASKLLAYATHMRKQTKIVTRLHRYEMYRKVQWINWETVDKIILVSQAKKKEFIDQFPEQAEKIVVIPEAIDVNKFQLRKKMFNGDIGILCDLTPRKRVYELILSFYELTKLHNGLHLHIGGGEHESFVEYHLAIQDLIKNLNLEDDVTLYGEVTEPARWYHNIDIFISNSYSEGLQVAPMEAMASGCYCLSHRWSGAEELLPEEELFYSDREMIETILHYCDYSEKEKQLHRERMRTHVCENFDIDKTKVQIREIIEDVGSAKMS